MKIGILTFHRAINYGAVMQAHSLSERLKKEFPDDQIEIIDYNCKARERFKIKCPIVFLYRRSIREGIEKLRQTLIFNKFIKRLSLSKSLLGKDGKTAEDYISNNYDVLVVGSDAVFNWNDIGLPNIYFAGDINVKHKLTYAASAHLQKYELVSNDQKDYINRALNDFEYVGVRDASSEKFVKMFSDNENVNHNCDPTAFLDMKFPEDNLKRKLEKHGFDFNKKTIFVMLMHPEIAKMVKKHYGDEYQIVALMDGNKYADIYLYDLNPYEWAHVFPYGNMLVTDYFHGTMLSLKNGTPVLSVDASGYCDENYQSKAYDLLHTRLDTPELYVNIKDISGENGYENFCKRADAVLNGFDKNAVAEKLAEEAKSFDTFLEELKKIHNKEVQ